MPRSKKISSSRDNAIPPPAHNFLPMETINEDVESSWSGGLVGAPDWAEMKIPSLPGPESMKLSSSLYTPLVGFEFGLTFPFINLQFLWSRIYQVESRDAYRSFLFRHVQEFCQIFRVQVEQLIASRKLNQRCAFVADDFSRRLGKGVLVQSGDRVATQFEFKKQRWPNWQKIANPTLFGFVANWTHI